MELVDRYLYAVCKHLPAKTKKDIGEELRSSIMDALDARSCGATPSHEDILAVLREFGPPRKVAHNYTNRGGYLIGPQLFDLYVLILKIVLVIAFLGIVIGFVVQAAQGTEGLNIISIIGQLYSALVGTVGMVTLVFAFAERLNPDWNAHPIDKDLAWNPEELPAIPQSYEHVKISEIIVGMLFSVLCFILINFYTNLLGIYIQAEGQKSVLFLSLIDLERFSPYIPFINILLVFSLIKQLLLLKDGRYKASTYLMELLGNLLTIAIVVFMLIGPAFIDLQALDLVIKNPERLATLKKVLVMLYRAILISSGVIGGIEIFKYGIRYLRYRSGQKAPQP